jgi:anti-anti-sigma regulatory factor
VNTPSGISTCTLHDVVWLTVEGRGSFQNSPELKLLVRQGVDQGKSRMVVDLIRCSGMDSTFMGMLSCVAIKLEDAGGCLHVVNAGVKNGGLLRGLGLDEVFTVEEGSELVEDGACGAVPGEVGAPSAEVPRVACSKSDQRSICLEAHEALAAVKEANAEKFRDVIQLMKQPVGPVEATR